MSKVTVVISTCDRPVKLGYAVESVLAQTFQDWELKVVGDHCDEHTARRMSRYDDPRIQYINLDERHGKKDHGSTPKNVGVSAGTGEYVAYLDDDDVYFPDHLEKSVAYLDANLDVGMVYGCSLVYKFLDFRRFKLRDREFDKEVHKDHPFINTCEVVHRRSIVSLLPELWRVCGYFNDYDLWKRISEVSKIVHLKHVAATQHFAHDVLLKNEMQRLRRSGSPIPVLSFIVGVRGRTRYLEECMRQLESQNRKELFEVIVVDQGPGNDSRKAMDLFSGRKNHVALSDNGPFHRAWVNNVGTRIAMGDFFCFLDCDCLLPPNFVDAFVSLRKGQIDDNFHVRTRRKWLQEKVTERIFSRAISFKDAMRLAELDGNTNAHGSGKVVPRKVFFDLRGFDEQYDKGWGFEDVDLHDRLMQAGCRDIEFSHDEVAQFHLWHPTEDHPRVERGEHYVYWKRMSRHKEDKRFLYRNPLIDWGGVPREVL